MCTVTLSVRSGGRTETHRRKELGVRGVYKLVPNVLTALKQVP